MRVFVTGGTGFVGSVVLARLVQAEHEVIALVRDPKKLVVRGVQGVVGRLEEQHSWEELLRGCDACVHMVGILREDPENRITFDRVHYQDTIDLLRCCARAGVERFVYLSANGVERALRLPYMTSKAKAEQAVRASGLAWTLLRPSVIYGGRPDLYNFIGTLRDNLNRLPAFPYFGDGTYRMAPISADEVADAVAASLSRDDACNQVYHLCGQEVYTYKALLRMMNDIGGYRCRVFSLPFWMIETAAALLGGQAWFPLTTAMVRLLKEGNTCPPNVKTGQDLGVEPVSLQAWLQKNLTRRPELPAPAPFVPARPSLDGAPGVEVAHATRDLRPDDPHLTRALEEEAKLTRPLGGEAKLTRPLDADPKQTRPLDVTPKMTRTLSPEDAPASDDDEGAVEAALAAEPVAPAPAEPEPVAAAPGPPATEPSSVGGDPAPGGSSEGAGTAETPAAADEPAAGEGSPTSDKPASAGDPAPGEISATSDKPATADDPAPGEGSATSDKPATADEPAPAEGAAEKPASLADDPPAASEKPAPDDEDA